MCSPPPCCRVVRADLAKGGAPSTWPDIIPQHHKDLLQSAVALEGDELIIRSANTATHSLGPWLHLDAQSPSL